jgi:hypothetical protein
MSRVGKILVFVNLLFSLVVGLHHHGLHRPDQLGGQLPRISKPATRPLLPRPTAFAQSTREMLLKIAQEMDKLKADNKRLTDEMAVKDGQFKAVTDQLAAEKEKTVISDASTTAVQQEALRRQEEIKLLADDNKKLNDRLSASIIEQTKLRDRAVAVEIENKTLKDRNNQLALQLEDMGKENIRLRNVGGAAASTTTLTAKDPPLENVEGIVQDGQPERSADAVDRQRRGADQGPHGNEIFRLNPAKYLGTVPSWT